MLELNFKQGDKVKVSPIGDIVGVDGRTYTIDGKKLITSIVENDVHVVLDANHSFDEAVGWFDKDSFELRNDGVYATLEFNSEGMELTSDKRYRYLSPVYVMGSNSIVIGLDSVGFVNRPNLLTTELNTKKERNKMTPEERDQLKKDIVKEVTETLKPIDPVVVVNDIAQLNNEIVILKEALTQTNTKLNAFGKGSAFDPNTHTTQLSENDKKVATLLGITEEAYLKTKTGGK